MRLLDFFTACDDALDWQDDDPFLDDHVPSLAVPATWVPNEQVA